MAKEEYKFGQPERPEQEPDSKYREAPKYIIELAKDLIEKQHGHLKQCKIQWEVFEDEMKYRGKKVPGRVYKVHDREKIENDYDIRVVISEPIFEQLSEENYEEAALDWVLCFVTIGSEEGTWTTTDPDFYGFYNNVDRYGMWDRPLKTLEKRLQQQKLPFESEPESEVV